MWLTYDNLDMIADAYIPSLGILVGIYFIYIFYKKDYYLLKKSIISLLILLFFSYGFMFLDNTFGWWPTLGLDYSTHTALAMSLVLFLSFYIKKIRIFTIISFIAYVLLMLYQKYHTLADIITTASCIVLAILITLKYTKASYLLTLKKAMKE